MKRIWKDYFSFTRKERSSVILLLSLMAIFLLFPHFYKVNPDPPLPEKALLEYIAKSKSSYQNAAGSEVDAPKAEVEPTHKLTGKSILFPFDPNTLPAEEWVKLGLADKTVRNLLQYRAKGGRFYKPGDLRKIWGMTEQKADELIPFVRIQRVNKSFQAEGPGSSRFPAHKVQQRVPERIDINRASVADWEKLPGIGEVLSRRIVKFREIKGGFREISEVRKTYGISDSLFQSLLPYLVLDTNNLPKLNLNRASAIELSNLAGIPLSLARAIVLYRKQNGPFADMEAVKKLVLISDSVWIKLNAIAIVD